MTSFTCAGSLLADMCTVPFSGIFSASLWYPFMSVSFWPLLMSFCSLYWWGVLAVVAAHAVAYNAGLLFILFSISASGSVVLLGSVLVWCCRYVSAVIVVDFYLASVSCNASAIVYKLDDIWSAMVIVVAPANYCPMGPWTAVLMLNCYSWPYGNIWKYWWGIIVIFSLPLY